MSEKETDHKRLISLPRALWDTLDRDAAECRRSSQKQLEAILVAYYELGRVDLGDVATVREMASPYKAGPAGGLRLTGVAGDRVKPKKKKTGT